MPKRDMWEYDERDGLKREIVHAWVEEKHARLRNYVGISRQARRKFSGNCSYIDLYSGTGRARIEESGQVVDGSALVAATEAAKLAPFGQIHIGDLEAERVEACRSRLEAAGMGGVSTHVGPAEETAVAVAARLNRYGLHLAFLDPYNLGAMPFAVIETLGRFPRMDLLIHVSAMDLTREAVGKKQYDKLDRFAPGWRSHCDTSQRQEILRGQVMQHWFTLLGGLGYNVRHDVESVTGNRNQPLYWLAFASKSPIADEFWAKIRNVLPQGRLL